MKLLTAAILLSISAAASAQNINDEIDRFTGQRKISYTSDTPISFGAPNLTIKVNQGGGTPISVVQFMVSPEPGRYATQRAQFIGCRTVDWLVDGRPMKMGMVVHDIKHFDRVLIEFITQEVEIDQLAQIGGAQLVEYRICGKEGALSPADIAAAARIAAIASGAPLPPPPPPPPASQPDRPAAGWRSWGDKS